MRREYIDLRQSVQHLKNFNHGAITLEGNTRMVFEMGIEILCLSRGRHPWLRGAKPIMLCGFLRVDGRTQSTNREGKREKGIHINTHFANARLSILYRACSPLYYYCTVITVVSALGLTRPLSTKVTPALLLDYSIRGWNGSAKTSRQIDAHFADEATMAFSSRILNIPFENSIWDRTFFRSPRGNEMLRKLVYFVAIFSISLWVR